MHFTTVAGPRLLIRTKIHIRTVNKLVDKKILFFIPYFSVTRIIYIVRTYYWYTVMILVENRIFVGSERI